MDNERPYASDSRVERLEKRIEALEVEVRETNPRCPFGKRRIQQLMQKVWRIQKFLANARRR